MKSNRGRYFRRLTFIILLTVLLLSMAVVIGSGFGLCLRRSKISCTGWAKAYLASLDWTRPKPGTNPKPERSPKDGMALIYIPAGTFVMGDNDEDLLKSGPEHTVYLDSYWMDETEVTNAMYLLCVAAGKCIIPVQESRNPYIRNPIYANYPVIYVRWDDASNYCAWAGRRLPTEAEWEKAARGTDGRIYPWGDEEPNPGLANYGNNLGEPLPVDRYPSGASPYGVLNMTGNVREWVNDWYSPIYYRHSPLENPPGPNAGRSRALRGGSFLDDARQIRVYNRFGHFSLSSGADRGFRCAMSENAIQNAPPGSP
jgi:formylglycine-generating enzyme required for sulfatase activity